MKNFGTLIHIINIAYNVIYDLAMAHRRFECVVKSGQSPGLFDIYDSFCTLPYYLQLPILRECVLVLKKHFCLKNHI